MVTTKTKSVLGLLSVAVLGAVAQASPSVAITDTVFAAYDPTTSSYTKLASLPNINNAVAHTYLYEVDISFAVTGATSTEPYLTQLVFNLTPSSLPGGTIGGLIPASSGAPAGQTPALVAPPTARNGYKGTSLAAWQIDDGSGGGTTTAGPGFLKNTNPNTSMPLNILLDMGSGPFDQVPVDSTDTPTGGVDPRSTLAQSSAFLVGRAYFYWDGQEKQTFDLTGLGYGIWNTNTNLIEDTPGSITAPTITFGANIGAPEPASLGVLALGAMALLARRRKA